MFSINNCLILLDFNQCFTHKLRTHRKLQNGHFKSVVLQKNKLQELIDILRDISLKNQLLTTKMTEAKILISHGITDTVINFELQQNWEQIYQFFFRNITKWMLLDVNFNKHLIFQPQQPSKIEIREIANNVFGAGLILDALHSCFFYKLFMVFESNGSVQHQIRIIKNKKFPNVKHLILILFNGENERENSDWNTFYQLQKSLVVFISLFLSKMVNLKNVSINSRDVGITSNVIASINNLNHLKKLEFNEVDVKGLEYIAGLFTECIEKIKLQCTEQSINDVETDLETNPHSRHHWKPRISTFFDELFARNSNLTEVLISQDIFRLFPRLHFKDTKLRIYKNLNAFGLVERKHVIWSRF